GDVVSRLSGLVKDNTGYDLAQLLCGSEGTLGVVTRLRLTLVPAPEGVSAALVALGSVAAAVELASVVRREQPGVRALEFMTPACLDRVAVHLGRSLPVPVPTGVEVGAWLLVELDGDEAGERLAGVIADRPVAGV